LRAPRSWLLALERAEADVVAGRTHDFEEIMRALEAEDAPVDTELEKTGKPPGPAAGQ
jgi:hypothetical protein